MTATFLGKLEGEAWHAARAGRVGGSDCGAIIGHGFRTYDELMAEKLSGERQPDSPAMARGRWLEPAGLAYLSDRHHITYDESKDGTWVDGWRLYNPDGITADGRLVEIKSTRSRDGWGRGGTVIRPGDPVVMPIGYYAQVQWGMSLLDIDECLIGVIATKDTRRGPDFDFATYTAVRDSRFGRWLHDQATAFHEDMTHRKEALAT